MPELWKRFVDNMYFVAVVLWVLGICFLAARSAALSLWRFGCHFAGEKGGMAVIALTVVVIGGAVLTILEGKQNA